MRPVRLIVEGFTAFRDLAELDFTDADFFALVGPTGSGKSSVIDAVCFALYGCVPRYENRNAVAPAITTGSLEAKVSLEFSVGTDSYLATRVVRRQPKGGATTKEARLERLQGETTDVLAGTADEVSAAVEQLLGLTFEHFTRCVVLPQGEFARFLHDKPSDRQALLRSLLGIDIYTRIGQRAREQAAGDKGAAALYTQQLVELAPATPEALEAAEARAEALRRLSAGLREAEGHLALLQRQIEDYAAAAVAAQEMAERLGAIGVPVAIEVASGKQRELEAAAGAAEDRLGLAGAARQELEAAAEALPALGPLEAAGRAHAAVAALVADIELAATRVTDAERDQQVSDAALQLAAQAQQDAAAAVEAVRRQHSAAHLAASLVPGEPCPVCRQPVATLPRHEQLGAIEQAEQAALAADGQLSAARSSVTSRAKALATAEASHESLLTLRWREAELVRDHPDQAAVERAIIEIRQAAGGLAEARKVEDDARAEHTRCLRKADAARVELAAAWAGFDAQRDPVVSLGPPIPGRADVALDWTSLVEWARAELPAQKALATSATKAGALAAAERDEDLAGIVAKCLSSGVDVEGSSGLPDIGTRVAGALEAAAGQCRSIAADLAKADALRERVVELSESALVAEMLASHLRSTGFERWLVAEALDTLVTAASETLRRLSGGQYSLGHDGKNEFMVVDHGNADEQRVARTLSGGETFQASLALALALAEQLPGMTTTGTARIESIFLDEGFGTLDPDALAMVADTIEALGSDERMVGIVTHVRELADRVPVRYEVSKNSRTSTVSTRLA